MDSPVGAGKSAATQSAALSAHVTLALNLAVMGSCVQVKLMLPCILWE